MTNLKDTNGPRAYAEQALSDMNERDIAPTPDNYEIWYTHASGANPKLAKALEEISQTGETLDDAKMAELHAAHFGGDSNDAMLEMGNKIEGELTGVMEMLESAAKDTGDYGASLNDVSAALGGDRSEAELRTLVETLVTATKTMEKRSKELEGRLQESKAEVTQLRDNMEQIRTEALTDQLTGLANRRRFDDMMRCSTEDAAKEGAPLTLVLGDIDHFKKFNDTWGHQTGDQVLKLVAQCMRQHVKAPLLPARYGGEEFAMVMPGLEVEDAVKIADLVRRTIEGKELVKKSTGENLGAVTMSFGAALYSPGESVTDLIKRADACLYSAKRAGRNRVMTEVSDDLKAMAG